MTPRRPYRRNLLRLGYERAAKFIYTAVRFSPNGGRKSVFIDDDGGISVYPVNHPAAQDKMPHYLVGVYGQGVQVEHLEDDLIIRQRELAALGHVVRSKG
jgi:hypothetical protein